ncbi:MAG: hypothetical protein ACRDEB_01015 [Chitinophagaceae bacterium]
MNCKALLTNPTSLTCLTISSFSLTKTSIFYRYFAASTGGTNLKIDIKRPPDHPELPVTRLVITGANWF